MYQATKKANATTNAVVAAWLPSRWTCEQVATATRATRVKRPKEEPGANVHGLHKAAPDPAKSMSNIAFAASLPDDQRSGCRTNSPGSIRDVRHNRARSRSDWSFVAL